MFYLLSRVHFWAKWNNLRNISHDLIGSEKQFNGNHFYLKMFSSKTSDVVSLRNVTLLLTKQLFNEVTFPIAKSTYLSADYNCKMKKTNLIISNKDSRKILIWIYINIYPHIEVQFAIIFWCYRSMECLSAGVGRISVLITMAFISHNMATYGTLRSQGKFRFSL